MAMVDIKKPQVDAVLVGFGWTGAIMGMELTEAGLNMEMPVFKGCISPDFSQSIGCMGRNASFVAEMTRPCSSRINATTPHIVAIRSSSL